ncbi:sugar transferase [Patescibacteria group bacterium]|nr:sugar transferase [Patescibacteria group bacterium]
MVVSAHSLSDWLQWGVSCCLLILVFPLFLVLSLLIWLTSGWPVFFVQKRVGRDGQVFKMYKFRTMIPGAEELRGKYETLNEADGPVFKIKYDPRFTKIGRYLCHSGLDELPQLINVVLGQMNLIGPRPLPVREAKEIPEKYQKVRITVKPGIISTWVLNGQHKMSFKAWMEEDIKYIQNRSLRNDCKLFFQSMMFFVVIVARAVVVKRPTYA